MTGWPVAASQTRAVLSKLAVTTRVPSGLNAALVHRVLMLEGAGDGLAGGRVPHARGLVHARGDDAACRRG